MSRGMGIVTLRCFTSRWAKFSKPVASNFNGLAVWLDAQNGLYLANVTTPTEAFPWTSAPAYLVRDNDRAYGHAFRSRVRAMGIRDRQISPGSPWQNAYVERLIGTVRRESLDRMLVFGEAHLRQILSSYGAYYNEVRTHLALNKDAPLGRAV